MALDRVPRKRQSYDPGDPRAPKLFKPIALRGINAANRIVVSPMGQHTAIDGFVDDWHLMHLGQFAASGVGTVFTGNVALEPNGRVTQTCLGLWSDEHVAAFGTLRRFVSDHSDARLGIQFNHCGRKGSTTTWQTGSRHIPVSEGGWPVEGPGTIPFNGRATPSMMTEARIEGIVQSFAAGTVRAERAGFELIELHAAHGYLLHQFLSPLSNNRDDRFGGSLENRMRFPLMVFEVIRAHWPAEKPVGVRVSATDWAPGGWSPEETLVFAEALKQRGCDFLCVSSGGTVPQQDIPVGPLYQVPFAEMVRKQVGLPVTAVGLITTPEEAERVLEQGKADMIAIGRAIIENPHWAWNAARALGGRLHLPANYVGLGPG